MALDWDGCRIILLDRYGPHPAAQTIRWAVLVHRWADETDITSPGTPCPHDHPCSSPRGLPCQSTSHLAVDLRIAVQGRGTPLTSPTQVQLQVTTVTCPLCPGGTRRSAWTAMRRSTARWDVRPFRGSCSDGPHHPITLGSVVLVTPFRLQDGSSSRLLDYWL